MTDLQDRLKFLIKDLSIKEVASELDIHVSTFHGYCYGHRTPNLKLVKQMANYFNVTIDYLMGNSDIPNPDLDKHLQTVLGAEGNDLIVNPFSMEDIKLGLMIKELDLEPELVKELLLQAKHHDIEKLLKFLKKMSSRGINIDDVKVFFELT